MMWNAVVRAVCDREQNNSGFGTGKSCGNPESMKLYDKRPYLPSCTNGALIMLGGLKNQKTKPDIHAPALISLMY